MRVLKGKKKDKREKKRGNGARFPLIQKIYSTASKAKEVKKPNLV
jgi:hypothetical protein